MHSNMGRNKGYEHSAGIRNGDQLAGDAAENYAEPSAEGLQRPCNGESCKFFYFKPTKLIPAK